MEARSRQFEIPRVEAQMSVGEIKMLPNSIRNSSEEPPLAAEEGVTRHPGAGAAGAAGNL